MSISAMKQALSTLEGWANHGEWVWPESALATCKRNTEYAITALRQAIAEAKKQEPVAQCSYPKCQATNGCVGACSKTAPVHAIDMSEKHVQISDKDRLIRIMGTFDLATGHADTMDQALDALESELRDVLGYLRARREWVGLTDEERKGICNKFENENGHIQGGMSYARAIEAKLKEKNT